MKNDLSDVDLNLLVAFSVLMTQRGVTRAGRVLGITQAAMSNTLRRLRLTFDNPLFVKAGHRMEPTPRALELAPMVEAALACFGEALNQERFDPGEPGRIFRLALSDEMAPLLLPRLLDYLERSAPAVAVEAIDDLGHDAGKALSAGAADLYFGSVGREGPPELRRKRLFSMGYACLHRRGHPILSQDFGLESFLAAPHVERRCDDSEGMAVDQALARLSRRRERILTLPSMGMAPFLVARTDFIAVMPEASARFLAGPLDLELRSPPLAIPPMEIAVVWHERSENSPAHAWLRGVVHALMQSDSNQAGPDKRA